MTRLLSVCAAAFLLCSPAALAKSKVKVKKKKERQEQSSDDAAPHEEHGSGTSADNRRHKTAALYLEPIGLTFTPVRGARGEFFLSGNNLISVSYVVSSQISFFTWSYKKSIFDAKFKHFFTNSFYMDGGLGLESYEITYDVYTNGGSTIVKTLNGTASNIGAEIHIGNQWQWTGFTIGCDWAGYFMALSKSFTGGAADGVDADNKADQESMVQGNLNAGSAHLVRLYVGWAF